MRVPSVFVPSCWLLAGLAAAARTCPSQDCCNALSKHLPHDQVYSPSTPSYVDRIKSYFSVSAALQPWCIVLPSSAQEVSSVIQILTEHQCPFGILSGGHGVFPGANSVQSGVTIDLGLMNATTYDVESKTASIQPGSRWKPVFETLARHGVAVTGGRDSDVGAGGFLLGGGNSFWSASHGWACDNVVNFEVVLADGRIVNANADDHADLWTALKGGSGNFGIVTRFDMKTIEYSNPQNHIYGGSLTYKPESTKEAIAALVDYVDNQSKDLASHAYTVWGHIPSIGAIIMSFIANVLNDDSTSTFDGILGVPGMTSSSVRSDVIGNFTDEILSPKGYRNIWETSAYKNDARVIQFAVDKFNEIAPRIEAAVSPENLILVAGSFQPLTKSMVSQGAANGGNVLGLEERVEESNGVLFNAVVSLAGAKNEKAALPLMREWMDSVDEFAKSADLSWGWRYLNYAYAGQDPIASYGSDSVEKIKAAAAKYDPHGVFQKLRMSGFKIPT
ncbi:FAD binding domain-containing protein [Astrocystis sublimbata]|nr:FAD binding domain-containing protein [Astrocystis sublimbata]